VTALAASDVTVTIVERIVLSKKKMHFVTLTFGNGSLTYPTAGVPLPGFASFGFVRELTNLVVLGVNERTSEYALRFGPANKTLLMYEEEGTAAGGPLLECDTSEAPAARTYTAIAFGW
jgi:hypothetical protein